VTPAKRQRTTTYAAETAKPAAAKPAAAKPAAKPASTATKIVKVDAKDGETIAAVCARLGHPNSKGCGFYLLTKKEAISAGKEIILWNGSSYVQSAADVRKALGLGAGNVTVTPSDIGDNQALYVQSTSATRKLTAGPILLRIPKSDDDDEDEEDEEDEEATTATSFDSTICRVLESLSADSDVAKIEFFAEPADEQFADEVVPVRFLTNAANGIFQVAHHVRWCSEPHTTSNGLKYWTATSGGAKLYCSDNGIAALYAPEQRFSIVVATLANSKPDAPQAVIRTAEFYYDRMTKQDLTFAVCSNTPQAVLASIAMALWLL
jgi:hypothetical protein